MNDSDRRVTDERRRRRQTRLWRRWRAGDTRARDALIESLMPLAESACRRRGRVGQSAALDRDDMLSAAYVALVRAVERYDPAHGTPIEAFVWPRCDGAVIDWMRQQSPPARRPPVSLDAGSADEQFELGDALVASDRREDPAASMELVDRTRIVREAVERLPERERLAIAAPALEGRGLSEVGEALGVSIARVSQLRARAMERLQEELAPHDELMLAA